MTNQYDFWGYAIYSQRPLHLYDHLVTANQWWDLPLRPLVGNPWRPLYNPRVLNHVQTKTPTLAVFLDNHILTSITTHVVLRSSFTNLLLSPSYQAFFHQITSITHGWFLFHSMLHAMHDLLTQVSHLHAMHDLLSRFHICMPCMIFHPGSTFACQA